MKKVYPWEHNSNDCILDLCYMCPLLKTCPFYRVLMFIECSNLFYSMNDKDFFELRSCVRKKVKSSFVWDNFRDFIKRVSFKSFDLGDFKNE